MEVTMLARPTFPSIYLISPPALEIKEFLPKLEEALGSGQVALFQLRLKEGPSGKQLAPNFIKEAALEISKLCASYNIKFLLDDHAALALEIGADGVHLGKDDYWPLDLPPKTNKEFIIGASCYDSKERAAAAIKQGASYVSFGTFFPSITKNSGGHPAPEIISWCHERYPDIPVVAIGGINEHNCGELVRLGADFIAVISYVWHNELGITKALQRLSCALKAALK